MHNFDFATIRQVVGSLEPFFFVLVLLCTYKFGYHRGYFDPHIKISTCTVTLFDVRGKSYPIEFHRTENNDMICDLYDSVDLEKRKEMGYLYLNRLADTADGEIDYEMSYYFEQEFLRALYPLVATPKTK